MVLEFISFTIFCVLICVRIWKCVLFYLPLSKPLILSTMNISFYCKQAKVNKKGLAHIQLCLNMDKRIFINLPRQEKPEVFKKAMASRKSNNIKEYCDSVKRKVDDIVKECMDRNIPLTATTMKEYWERGGATKAYTLEDMWDTLLSVKEKELLSGKLSQDTYDRYRLARDRFYEYTGFRPDNLAREVTQSDILKLRAEADNHYVQDAAGNLLSKCKMAFKLAFESGKIPSLPFAGVKIIRGKAHNESKVDYLTQEEVAILRDKVILNKRLREIRDCFLFQCYTGISFADLKLLEPSDFKKADNGFYYISKTRKKTGTEFTAVLLKDAALIALMYDFKLPVKSNTKYNNYLKELADICGIEKRLHTHIARHTAAMYLLNHRPAISTETIKKIFGWTNDRIIRTYAKTLDTTVIEEISRVETEEDRFGREIAGIILG